MATDALGQLDDFKTFLAQARSHSSAGYPSPRHNQLHGTLHGQLLAYMGQPTAGKGVIGTACACMCGEPPEGETSMNPIQRRRLRSFVRNLLLSGQSPLVDPLLDPRSESALPGLKKIITDVVQSLGMSIEEQ